MPVWWRRLKRLAWQARFFSYRWRLYANAERFVPRLRGRVLDIGAERQPFRPFLPPGVSYHALDVVPAPGLDLVGSALALPLADAVCDGIICTEVVEHVPEPEHALREMARVLTPGGLLYLTVPMTWGHHYVPHDYYRFTRYGLLYLLDRAGFDVEEVVQIGGLFIVIAARLQDLVGAGVFKLCYPLKFVLGPRGRAVAASLVFLPLALLMDAVATLLDAVVPAARQDALGWSVLAVRR